MQGDRVMPGVVPSVLDRYSRVHYIVPGEDPFASNSVDVFTPWLHKHRSFELISRWLMMEQSMPGVAGD
jgi:hypothetical protein